MRRKHSASRVLTDRVVAAAAFVRGAPEEEDDEEKQGEDDDEGEGEEDEGEGYSV